MRRVRYLMFFPRPDASQRLAIWRQLSASWQARTASWPSPPSWQAAVRSRGHRRADQECRAGGDVHGAAGRPPARRRGAAPRAGARVVESGRQRLVLNRTQRRSRMKIRAEDVPETHARIETPAAADAGRRCAHGEGACDGGRREAGAAVPGISASSPAAQGTCADASRLRRRCGQGTLADTIAGWNLRAPGQRRRGR